MHLRAGAGHERTSEKLFSWHQSHLPGGQRSQSLSALTGSHTAGACEVEQGPRGAQGAEEKPHFSPSCPGALSALSPLSIPVTMVTSPFFMPAPILAL